MAIISFFVDKFLKFFTNLRKKLHKNAFLSKNSEKPPFGALAIIPRPPPRGQKNSPLKSFHRFTIYLVPPSKMAQKGGFWGFLASPPYPPLRTLKLRVFCKILQNFCFCFR